MATLLDMINHKIVNVGDTITFTFKGNKFSAKLLRGGMIGGCTIKRVHDAEPEVILKQTAAFSSLTAWTEACLQDIMDEYYTRYSSWKRVIHHESKRSMGDLRDQCKLLEPSKMKEDTTELYKEIVRLHGTIDEMNSYVLSLHNGELLELKQWSYLNVDTQKKIPEIAHVNNTIDTAVHDKIQTYVCTNDGELYQYLNG